MIGLFFMERQLDFVFGLEKLLIAALYAAVQVS